MYRILFLYKYNIENTVTKKILRMLTGRKFIKDIFKVIKKMCLFGKLTEKISIYEERL